MRAARLFPMMRGITDPGECRAASESARPRATLNGEGGEK